MRQRPVGGMRIARQFWSAAEDSRSGSRTRFGSTSALLRGADIMQVQGGSDESQMRERLREIADQPPRMGIVFFREQADVVAERQQAFEQCGCFGVAVLQRVIVGQPEAAGKKYALSRRETVDASLGAIAEHEAVDDELLLDGGKGAAHSRIIRRQEPHDRHQQQARVELTAAEALREGVAAAVESLLANGRVHVVAQLPPTLERRWQVVSFRIAHRAIE